MTQTGRLSIEIQNIVFHMQTTDHRDSAERRRERDEIAMQEH